MPTCSGAQSKCGGRAIKGTFRRTIGENIGDHERTLFGLLANFDTAGEFGAVRERQEPRGEVLVGRDEAASCGSSASCPSALKSVRLFPRRRCVSPALRFPKAAATCACATSWARYSMTAGSRVCSPHAAAGRRHPGGLLS